MCLKRARQINWQLVCMLVLVVGVGVGVGVGAASGWNCICNPRDCEVLEPSGCPGRGFIVWDSCKCCKICARTLGESCGGFRGTCEPGLYCLKGTCIVP